MSELVLIYVPLPDQKTGQMMAQRLLEQKLIACANIFSPHIAVYSWNGAICDDPEVVTIFKTTAEKYEAATKAIEELHPYDTPAIIRVDTSQTNSSFLEWANQQTQ